LQKLHEVDLHALNIERYGPVVGQATVDETLELAGSVRSAIDGRVIWHINSTAAGGGVAEMLPALLGYCRGQRIATRWLVMAGNPDFFRITKRLHHALHGETGGGTPLDDDARQIYERTIAANAAELLALVRPGDIVILHDPQTIGLAPSLSGHGARVIWRCHIGRDEQSAETDAAWAFLAPYLEHAVKYVFSRAHYVPDRLDHGKSVIIHPSIDAFSPKNQDMDAATVQTILVHTGLIGGPMPPAPRYEFTRSDGSTGRVDRYVDIIRCGQPPANTTPLVIQVSRWDPLKDPIGVMNGFAEWLARGNESGAELILAGPSVQAVADDPEGPAVFGEVFTAWCALPHAQRSRVHLAMLPMVDLEENAAIVNALQRHATVVVQKSIREGFGLTVTEAMWKARPVIASRVGGIRDQIEDGVDGLLLDDPADTTQFVSALSKLFGDRDRARALGEAARRKATEQFLEIRGLQDNLSFIRDVCRAQGKAGT